MRCNGFRSAVLTWLAVSTVFMMTDANDFLIAKREACNSLTARWGGGGGGSLFLGLPCQDKCEPYPDKRLC
jgi:hypothetical protein